MNERLKQLYKSIILVHNKAPFQYEKREDLPQILDAYNALCGDHYHLYIEIKDAVIEQIYFHGYGCAISKAATSILAKNLRGLTVENARNLCQSFIEMLTTEKDNVLSQNEEFEAFIAAKNFPGRLKCATLSCEAVLDFLETKEDAINKL